MAKRIVLLLASVLFIFTQPLPIQASELSASKGKDFSVDVSEMMKRLNVTSEQESEFIPIMELHFKEMDALFRKYNLNKENTVISVKELRTFRRNFLNINTYTKKQLMGILTESQIKEWDATEVETRKEVRRRFSFN